MNSKYEEPIRALFPAAKTIEWNEEGQNNLIAFVDKTWAFRFPKYEKPIMELKKEVQFFQYFGSKLVLPVPIPLYSNIEESKGTLYSVYRIIKGRSLSKKNRLTDIPNLPTLAKTLGQFLTHLHQLPINSQTLSILGEPEDPLKEWEDFSLRVEEKLVPNMRQDAKKDVLLLFERLITSLTGLSFQPTIIHGDFGDSNILIDFETGEVEGIIDFGSVVISDPAYDIASLMGTGNRGMGEDFIHLMEEVYPELDIQLERAKLYTETFALQEALFGFENNDKRAYKAGMEPYV